MSRFESGKAKPWTVLGLPLGGLLAFAALSGSIWDDSLLGPTALETAALDPHAGAHVLAEAAPAPAAPVTGERPDREGVMRRGDTLGGILAELGLAREEAHAAALASARHIDLRQLRPGARYAAWRAPDGGLGRLELALEGKGALALEREAGAWTSHWRACEREVRVRSVRGTLEGAFENSIDRAGADGELAYKLAEVLQWDLDFSRDLRRGDGFEALYEEVWLDGQRFGLGDVLAVRYDQGSRQLEAYRYGDGYYDAEGRPLEKLFLRSPMPYSRVTSRFSNRRFHPVLGVFRPHHGVDYGAPTGTPVRATASGTVIFAGWDGGGGKTVKVRHPNEYLTGYLHLSRFADGIRAGARVAQGEVIGFVGSTGLATGPHLDYRIQHRGRWIDPQSIASVPAEPLSRLEIADFRGAREAMRASLETGAPYRAPGPADAPVQVASAPTLPAGSARSGAARR